MSNYGDNQPPSSEPTPNPYGQPQPSPYGQPTPNPYEQQQPNPYEQQQQPNPYAQPQQPNPYGQQQPSANPYEQQQGQYQAGPPAQYGAGYGQPYGAVAQEHPQGTMVLVLGIVGIFIGICAPIAWIMGNKALGDIRTSGVTYSNESQIKTGRILGKVFTILYLVFIVLYIVAVVVIIGASSTAEVIALSAADAAALGPSLRAAPPRSAPTSRDRDSSFPTRRPLCWTR